MINKNEILHQLKSVNYPGFNRDIVSFGMVKEILVDHKTITIMLSISSQNEEKKKELIKEFQDTELYKKVLKKFPDANLTDVIMKNEKEE